KTERVDDFAKISTNGNLTINSAVYKENDESVDIQTSGNISLPDTTSGNKIGNLLIESGELTIETLNAANLTNDGILSTKTVTVTQNITNNSEITSDTVLANNDLENNGNLNAATSVQANNITNSGSMNVVTTNVGGNLTDSGTWAENGIIYFVGTGDQTFAPNISTTYKTVNVNKTSGTFTATTNPLKVGTLNLESPENNFVQVIANFVNLTNAGNTTFEGNVTCDQTLTITNATQTTFNESVEISSLSTNPNSGNITFPKGGTISEETEILSSGDVIFGTLGEDSTFIFGAEDALVDFTHNAGTTFIYGTIKAANITLADCKINKNIVTGNFVAENCIFAGELTAQNVTVTSLTSTDTENVKINLSGNFTKNGSSGSVNIYELNILDTSTLSGALTIGTLKAENLGGKTLTVNGEISVESMKISGSDEFNKVTIEGTGSIAYKTEKTEIVGKFIHFTGTQPEITLGTGQVSVVTYDGANIPSGWEIVSVYIWTGNESNDWRKGTNWDKGSVPNSEDVTVIIPVTNVYPTINNIYSNNEIKVKTIQIAQGASLSIHANASLEVVENCTNLGSIKNSGTLTINGNADFSSGTYTKADDDSDKLYINNNEIEQKIFEIGENQPIGNLFVTGSYAFNSAFTCTNTFKIEENAKVYLKGATSIKIVENSGEEFVCANDVVIDELKNYKKTKVQSGTLRIKKYSKSLFVSSENPDTIELSEGASLSIENDENTNLTITKIEFVKTENADDFATISTKGTLDVTNATYNIGDIQTNGIISLPDTTEDNKIGKLKIESGELTIDDLDANSLNVVTGTFKNTTMNVTSVENAGTIESTTVNVAGDLSNDGTMNVATTNIGGNLNDTGTWTESGIINFVGASDQSFDSNSSTKYAKINVEKLSGILTIKDVLNVTELNINSNVICEKSATIGELSIDMSSSENENFVKFTGGKLYKITTLENAKGNQTQKLTLGSTNEEKWNVYFENIPAKEKFSYVIISSSKSVKEDGTTLNELEYIATDENLVPFEKTTEGWFNFNKFYWIGKTSSSWNELSNWAATLAGTGTITECPPFDNSSLELYITTNSQNPLLIENELVANLLNIPAEKSVELNAKVTIQTIKNAGQIATQESVNVTTFETSGLLFVNAGILTIENYVPTSDKINLKEGATLKITQEETTIPDLTFVKTNDNTEDFAILEGNLSVENATYNSADIQTKGTITLPTTTEENKIDNLKIESGILAIENLHGANLTNAGTLSTKTVTVTQNITNSGSMNVATTNVGGNLTDNGTWNSD
ncbi:MAG: hypothetical protein IJ293_02220, partial [Treponema sp.]|nr:hypothetical protein [Treponema sp.]